MDMRDGFRIVDTDAHMMEPEWLWERYTEPEFNDRAPRMGEAPESGRRTFLVEGESFTREKGPYPMAAPAFLNAAKNAMNRFDRVRSTGFSAEGRLEDMDEEGVDVQVLYPTYAGQMLGRDFRDTDLLAACVRAYNNWACEYASVEPDRLRWAAAIPMQDVDQAIVEVKRASEAGCVGYYMRPNPVGGRTLWHADYEPLWDVIEATGKPVSTHDSASSSVPSFGDRMETHTAGHILSHPFEAMASRR
jgi:predicted TIM-barrel fold metal-dependent hydrolase